MELKELIEICIDSFDKKEAVKRIVKYIEEDRKISASRVEAMKVANEITFKAVAVAMAEVNKNRMNSFLEDNQKSITESIEDMKVKKVVRISDLPKKTTISEEEEIHVEPELKGELIETEDHLIEGYPDGRQFFVGIPYIIKIEKELFVYIVENNHSKLRGIADYKVYENNGFYLRIVSYSIDGLKKVVTITNENNDSCCENATSLEGKPELKIKESAKAKFIKFLKDEGVYDEYMKLNDNRTEGFECFSNISNAWDYLANAFDWANEDYDKWVALNDKWLGLIKLNNIKE